MNRDLVVTLILCTALVGCAAPAATPTPAALAAATDAPAATAAPSPSVGGAATMAPAPPTATAAPAATAAVMPGPVWVPESVDAAIAIHTRTFEYAPSGRPAGMDDPTQGCAPFDERRPVTMLTVTLRVYNRSDREMRNWYARLTTPAGQALYTCHRDLEALPVLPPGYYVDVTFGAFMEGGPVQVHGYVYDSAVGRSNELVF